MAHLAPVTPPNTRPLISTLSRKTSHFANPRIVHKICACTTDYHQQRHFQRRSIALGLAGIVLGFNAGDDNARAAARRPPPPPPEEKKDPNVSGLTAKILASKKRKEAMKESIAKLKEKGKPVQEPPK